MQRRSVVILMASTLASVGMAAFAQDAPKDVQSQLNAILAALPKFAIPMREVGDRFQNMYFAAKGGNWALAAYMSKYMNNAMNPAALTKPDEYKVWKGFYDGAFAPVNKAIQAKDFSAFETAYNNAIQSCNGCHKAMSYGFITVVKLNAPADNGVDYTQKSEPGDVPP
jgi:hypothetical protein